MATVKESNFFEFMEGVIVRLGQLRRVGTVKNYRAAMRSFSRFRKGEDIPLMLVNRIVMEDYQTYLKSAGLAPNSISFYMRILRAVYRRAVDQGVTDDRRPFRSVFTGAEKTHKRAVSVADIRRTRHLDLSRRPNLEFARDIFMFIFFCRGMSFIDAAFLKKTDIQGGVLVYRRHKTGQELYVKVVKPIRELIDRYSDDCSPYLLPVVSPLSVIDERKQYESALRRVNNSLKIIADMAKLPIPLTTYCARHSWATIAKAKNVPVSVISDALGHESVATTQIYLASIDASAIDRANELVIRDL